MITKTLRRIAILLNGAPSCVAQPAPREPKAAPVRSVCRPSTGGLDNPEWEFKRGSDLRSRFASRPLHGGPKQ